jgi:hypothetical protein
LVPIVLFLFINYRNKIIKNISLFIGILIIIYHTYLFNKSYKEYKFISQVNLFHIFFVSLIFIYIGLAKEISHMITQFINIIIYGVFILFAIKLIKQISINTISS